MTRTRTGVVALGAMLALLSLPPGAAARASKAVTWDLARATGTVDFDVASSITTLAGGDVRVSRQLHTTWRYLVPKGGRPARVVLDAAGIPPAGSTRPALLTPGGFGPIIGRLRGHLGFDDDAQTLSCDLGNARLDARQIGDARRGRLSLHATRAGRAGLLLTVDGIADLEPFDSSSACGETTAAIDGANVRIVTAETADVAIGSTASSLLLRRKRRGRSVALALTRTTPLRLGLLDPATDTISAVTGRVGTLVETARLMLRAR